jgi:hypothetical protein
VNDEPDRKKVRGQEFIECPGCKNMKKVLSTHIQKCSGIRPELLDKEAIETKHKEQVLKGKTNMGRHTTR